jgi:hypothetical protein
VKIETRKAFTKRQELERLNDLPESMHLTKNLKIQKLSYPKVQF